MSAPSSGNTVTGRSAGSAEGSRGGAPPNTVGTKASQVSSARTPSRSSATTWCDTPLAAITWRAAVHECRTGFEGRHLDRLHAGWLPSGVGTLFWRVGADSCSKNHLGNQTEPARRLPAPAVGAGNTARQKARQAPCIVAEGSCGPRRRALGPPSWRWEV